MRTAGLLLLGATPGVAVGYLLLTAYLLTRIRPLPITPLPYLARPGTIPQPPAGNPSRKRPSDRFSVSRIGWRTRPPRERQIEGAGGGRQ